MKVQIDVEYLLKVAGTDRASVVTIIDDFANMTADSLNELQTNITPEIQLHTLSKILHQLKGSSSSLGMVSLSQIFVAMENWDQLEWETRYSHVELIKHLEDSVHLCKEALA